MVESTTVTSNNSVFKINSSRSDTVCVVVCDKIDSTVIYNKLNDISNISNITVTKCDDNSTIARDDVVLVLDSLGCLNNNITKLTENYILADEKSIEELEQEILKMKSLWQREKNIGKACKAVKKPMVFKLKSSTDNIGVRNYKKRIK
jgi:hypothetical protein